MRRRTGYLLLEGLVLAAGVGVAAVWLGFTRSDPWRPLGRAAGAAILAAFVLLLPLLVVLVAYRGERRPSSTALFPTSPRSRCACGTTQTPTHRGHRVAALGTAIAGLILGKENTYSSNPGPDGVAGLVVSLRPELSFLGVEIPMPSKAIHSVVPYLCVFGRTAVLAALAGGFLAGILVDRLRASGRAPVRLLALGVALIASVDIVQRPPSPAADLGRPDPIATALRGADGAVAEYPLFGFDNFALGPYLLRQIRHGRPLLNGSVVGTQSADLAMAAELSGTRGPRGLDICRRPQHRRPRRLAASPRTRVFPTTAPERKLSLLGIPHSPSGRRSTRRCLRSEPGPDGSPFGWLAPTTSVRAVADGAGPVRIRMDAVSFGVPRIVRLGPERHEVGTSPTTVVLCVRTGSDGRAAIPISTTPPARLLPGGDARTVRTGVFHLSAQPAANSRAAARQTH